MRRLGSDYAKKADRQQAALKRAVLMAATIFIGPSIAGCNDSSTSPGNTDNFAARISGAITGRVSGPGIIRFLPGRDTGFGGQPASFFISDDSGVRQFGITFTIPVNTQPGTYPLVSPHPMDSGEVFEVRVDHSVGKRTESFYKKTQGTITIEAFPANSSNVTGHRVKGRFEFTAENVNGQMVDVNGAFDFIGT